MCGIVVINQSHRVTKIRLKNVRYCSSEIKVTVITVEIVNKLGTNQGYK
jgi:hypothetical protein